MALEDGERQVAEQIGDIRRDHVSRYEFLAKALPTNSRVLDFATGVGYGAKILAEAGHTVEAFDRDHEAIEFAREHFADPRIIYRCGDQRQLEQIGPDAFDAVVSFETIEHIEDPLPVLVQFRRLARRLFASVPNEDKFPHRGLIRFHHRHYFPWEFRQLLESAGFAVDAWYGQKGPESEVEPDRMGRTIIAACSRGEIIPVPAPAPKKIKRKEGAPRHVSIVGLGPSSHHYTDIVKRMGGRHAFCDETWALNSLGDVLAADRIFHMDDVRVQLIRAAAAPMSNIANMLRWMRTHPGPIYTSRLHPEFPGLVEFPLEDVLNDFGYAYFNNTASFAVAYAAHIGVEKMTLWGLDYSFAHSHDAEKGRANAEFWIGRAMERGISIACPHQSTLLDACVPERERLYGYDTVDVDIAETPERKLKVTFEERETWPTAGEIEARYDHSQPTVPRHLLSKS